MYDAHDACAAVASTPLTPRLFSSPQIGSTMMMMMDGQSPNKDMTSKKSKAESCEQAARAADKTFFPTANWKYFFAFGFRRRGWQPNGKKINCKVEYNIILFKGASSLYVLVSRSR